MSTWWFRFYRHGEPGDVSKSLQSMFNTLRQNGWSSELGVYVGILARMFELYPRETFTAVRKTPVPALGDQRCRRSVVWPAVAMCGKQREFVSGLFAAVRPELQYELREALKEFPETTDAMPCRYGVKFLGQRESERLGFRWTGRYLQRKYAVDQWTYELAAGRWCATGDWSAIDRMMEVVDSLYEIKQRNEYAFPNARQRWFYHWAKRKLTAVIEGCPEARKYVDHWRVDRNRYAVDAHKAAPQPMPKKNRSRDPIAEAQYRFARNRDEQRRAGVAKPQEPPKNVTLKKVEDETKRRAMLRLYRGEQDGGGVVILLRLKNMELRNARNNDERRRIREQIHEITRYRTAVAAAKKEGRKPAELPQHLRQELAEKYHCDRQPSELEREEPRPIPWSSHKPISAALQSNRRSQLMEARGTKPDNVRVY